MNLPDKIRLKVLRRHIVNGIKGMSSGHGVRHCVVAEALRERFPNRHIKVGFTFADVGARRYHLTKNGSDFINRAFETSEANPTTLTLIKDK